MDDVYSFLESEINDTKQVIDAATLKLGTLQDLLRKYREKNPQQLRANPVPESIEGRRVSLNPDTFVDDTENKTQLVLEVVVHQQPPGIKAAGVFAEIKKRGIPINKNYVYSILNRQKKRGSIQHRRGKYYPTLAAFAPGGKGSAGQTETASEETG